MKLFKAVWIYPAIISVLFSCAAVSPAVSPAASPAVMPEAMEKPPEKPEKPQLPELIMGKGLVAAKDLSKFLLGSNPGADKSFVEGLAYIYLEEAGIEGVNHDVAFAQMCLETGFLKYGGLVTAEMNNFCGLGAMSAEQPGLIFEDTMIGVRAHIQHLKAYASAEPLNQMLVDPRYRFVRRGSSPRIEGLAGTWAVDPQYADKIANILERLYTFSIESL